MTESAQPTPAQDAALRQLTDTGQLTEEQARAVRGALWPAPQAVARQVSWLLEAAGYVGGGLMAGGIAIVLGERWGDLTRQGRAAVLGGLAVLFVVAALVLAGGRLIRVGRGPTGARRRVVGALLTSAAVPVAFAVSTVADVDDDPLVGLIAGLVVAVAAYALADTPYGVVMMAVMSLGVLATGLGRAGTTEATTAVVTVLGGLLWCLAAVARLVRPVALGLAIGLATALVGPQFAIDEYPWLGYSLGFGVAVGAFVLYHRVRELVLLIAGVIGLTVLVPELVNELTEGALAGASVLVVGGAVLIAASALGLRLRKVERVAPVVAEEGSP
ncbi:hypothetical protein GCM10009682_41970 [Luedemannella flava]|uniref:DUF2157 domain-containing protein n=1 Tax=Luedemannella flava TaxID=349316 RepID=A0ABN2MCX7_9ACTN